MNQIVIIGDRHVGENEPCFIIAEAGSNHNGDFDQARRLIDVAVAARADAVKFQVFRARRMYPKQAGQSDYLKIQRSIYEIITEMEMPYDWIPQLAEHCRTQGILFMSSVFDPDSIRQLDPYLAVHKIASYEMTHAPLVEAVARCGKPVICSTGAADLAEVEEAVRGFAATGNPNLILLQCTAAYPAPPASLNVRAVATMKTVFGVPIGFSDHSRDPVTAPTAAVAAGADVIEKHFTLSNDLPGPDHRFALEPHELKLMVESIRRTEVVLGSGEKKHGAVEKELREFARRSVFAVRDIAVGEVFSAENLDVLRNGNLPPGLPPAEFPRILGRKAARAVAAETALQREDVAW